ncbi:MAG: modulator of FtsH protease HflK [Chloroflexota bacterium]|nr:modulator of FtsH protease HflK [Chloroflexota bacterium]
MRHLVATIRAVGPLAYLATGVTVVQQDELGVVRRFGAVLREPWEPGLHWGLPRGIDQVERIKPGQTRTLTIGARDPQAAPLAQAPNPETDDFLTGDLNVVTAQAIVQYRVLDPVAFLFAARSVDATLAATAESALTRALAGRSIDDVLTTGRAEVADRMLRSIQDRADLQGLGISIRAVRLGRVAPPVPVAPAFADAARARSDRRQVVTQAEEYRDRALADARGQAREIADRAAGQFDRRVQGARGEADRFAKVLAESRKDLAATRRRLYLEALSELFPRFTRKVVVAPGRDIDISLFTEGGPRTTAGTPGGPR